MFRKLLCITVVCAATGWVAARDAYGQANADPDQVFESYLQAVGGPQALAAIQDRTVNGTVSVFGMSGTILWHEKVPNKSHQVYDFGIARVETWFDGNQGYRIDPNRGDGPYSAEEVEEAKDNYVIFPLLAYKEHGLKLRYVKTDKVGDRETDVVESTDRKDRVVTYTFDKSTHYLVQMVVPVPASQGGGTMEISFSDYRDVKGVKFPFKIINTTPALTFEIAFDSIEVNTGIADTVFQHSSP
jgi:hypothetical protein